MEIVIVILVVGIMAAVAVPVLGPVLVESKETATREELRRLAEAIAGTDLNSPGFEGDVGFTPSSLTDLTAKPDTIPAWSAFLHVGWNGPYIDSTGGEYLADAWGAAYVYDPVARTLTSNGSGSVITVSF